MSNPLSAWRLPDLPNAGYSTRAERELTDAIMNFMRKTERDRLRLVTIVLGGLSKWRSVAGDIWRGLPIDTDLVDSIYEYFTLQALDPLDQREFLDHLKNPAKKQEIRNRAWPALERQQEGLRLLQKWAP